ncbi:hypothetical protein GQ55_9G308800 [Panicum hallii var. hallii]|uniref:Uncharacterized protein n=1 Tax=Panicum hallii var. hallii TaxID=1504633 RepID=A0A2T7C7X5_9POAL|nr:hypothetical protein GQ55_9G308800 [Panicum hallii var. hallii]
MGRHEVTETAALSPAGGVGSSLGPRVSRFKVPPAAVSWRKISSRTLPRPVGAPLQRRRRARGGWSSCVGALFRIPPLEIHRPDREVISPAFCLVGREAARDLVVVWRMEPVQSSPRWLRSSSVDLPPGSPELEACLWPMHLQQWLYLVDDGVYCGLFQSFQAMELWLIWVSRESIQTTAGDGRRVWIPASKGSRDPFVVFLSSKGVCVICLVVLLPFVPSSMYLYAYSSLYRIFMVNTGTL